MTQGVERTRTPIVESGPAAEPPEKPASPVDNDAARAAQAKPDIFATVKRIKSIVSTLKGRKLGAPGYEDIDALASAILTSASLRNSGDGRISQLAEAIDRLERRIEAVLDAQTPIGQHHPGEQQHSVSLGASDLDNAVGQPFSVPEAALRPGSKVELSVPSPSQGQPTPPAGAVPEAAAAAPLRPRRSRPAPRLGGRDPLATLAVMTEEELIALFS